MSLSCYLSLLSPATHAFAPLTLPEQVLFLYLEMIWVLDPISMAVGRRVNPTQFYDAVNPLASVHRWCTSTTAWPSAHAGVAHMPHAAAPSSLWASSGIY